MKTYESKNKKYPYNRCIGGYCFRSSCRKALVVNFLEDLVDYLNPPSLPIVYKSTIRRPLKLKYFLLLAITLTIICKRNPFTFVKNVEFQWPLIIIISFGIQISLVFISIETKDKFEMILMATFLGIIIGLWKNRKVTGVKWIMSGALLNLLALLVHEGLMPVSETALKLTGQEGVSFEADSRHQLMTDSNFLWILGDWIPVYKYVLSPGDFFVGVGIIVLIFLNSSKWKKTGEVG